MNVRVLGPLEIDGDVGPVSLGGPIPRAVMAALVLARGRAVTTDNLVGLAWRDGDVRNLRIAISRLRAALAAAGAATIDSVPGGYRFPVAEGELDLARAEALEARARTEPAHHAVATLAEALTLWQGVPLADVDVPELAADGRRIDELRWRMLERQAACRIEVGDHEAAVGDLEAMVGQQPLRERLWEHLATALYAAGRPVEALRACRRCRDALADAGLDAGPSLGRLEEAIANRHLTLAGGPPRSVLRGPSGVVVLTSTTITIGADPASDVVVDDSAASRAHAVLRFAAGAWSVEDAGSRNGTWINGLPVLSATALHSGDRLRVGRTVLELDVAGEAPRRTTAVIEPPALELAQREVLAVLCRPLLDHDLLSAPATIDEVAATIGSTPDAVERLLGEVAGVLGVPPGPPWDGVARAGVASGAVRP